MKLAVFNGSPRGKTSNTKILVDKFIDGFESNGGEVATIDYLIKEREIEQQVMNFKNAGIVFIAMPLYVFAMPGIVKSGVMDKIEAVFW